MQLQIAEGKIRRNASDVNCVHEVMADMERPGGNWSVLICCLFPSRVVQPVLLCFEAINRCEVILSIHLDSVSSKDYGKLNIGEGHHFDTGAHLKNYS